MTVQAHINIDYKILKGDNTTLTPDSSLTFQCTGTKERFQNLYIDDMLLSSDSYTVEETESGLTFTINKSALNKLANGSHHVTVLFENGEANLTFTKADDKTAAPTTPTDTQKPAGNKTNKVATGDSAAVIPFMILLVLSFSVFAVTFRKKLTNR